MSEPLFDPLHPPTTCPICATELFRFDDPAQEPDEADAWSRVRLRLLETCSKLFHWDADPVAASKPAKCIDV